MAKKNKTYCHINIEERVKIQILLEKKFSLKEISKDLNRTISSISREIYRNGRVENAASIQCSKNLLVCNKCQKKAYCSARKFFYYHNEADLKAVLRNQSSQNRTRLSPDQVAIIDDIVTPGVRNGQSLHHIYVANEKLQSICSERTIRRLMERNELSVKLHELPRYVRHKGKKPAAINRKYNLKKIDVLYGRTFDDYLNYQNKHKRFNIVQYDSLIGKRSDKQAILTIHFVKYNFQFGILINKDDPNDVKKKIKKLFRKLGSDVVKQVFPINISDNGFEFSYFNQIEISDEGEVLCRTFFTRPYRSNDKSECERNHSLVRYLLPKGKSLDNLTQDQVDNVFSHINSYVRKSLNNSTPYELVLRKYGKQFLDAINIKRISKKKVRLRPII